MCLSPLNISLGSTRYFSPEASLLFNSDVPCGHCYQCRMTAFNDLFLRTRAEWRSCVRNNGLSLFLTFTYDEHHVPFMQYFLDDNGLITLSPVSRNFPGDNVLMTFNKSHQTNYFKNVRRFFDYWFDSKESFRYISVGEYGSQFTQRPHYHSIFFLDNYLSLCLLGLARAMSYRWSYDFFYSSRKSLVSSAISFAESSPVLSTDSKFETFLVEFFSYFWQYGITSASDKGLFVTSDTCSSYVSKYVCKNLDLLNYSRFSHFYDCIESWFNSGFLCCPYGHDFKKPLSYFLYYVKFFECAFYTVKSLSFGSSLLENFQTSDLDELLSILDKGVPVVRKSKLTYLPYPRYIQRKLFFNTRSDGSYYPSALGISLRSRLLTSRLNTFVKYVQNFDWSTLDTVPTDVFRDLGFGVDSCSSPADYFRSDITFLINKPLIVFIYCFLLQNRRFYGPNYLTVSQSFIELCRDRIPGDRFLDLTIPLLYPAEYSPISLSKDSPSLSDFYDSKSRCHLFELRDFNLDHILKFWFALINYLNYTLLKQYDDENKASKQLSDILNFEKYGISKNCS